MTELGEDSIPVVLLVEDEAPARRMLATSLRTLGCSVTSVPTAEAAEDVLEKHLPDLIIADIRLPGRNGLELTDALRCEERTASVPVLLMSAYDFPRIREGTRFIRKPFELDHFESLVQELCCTDSGQSPA